MPGVIVLWAAVLTGIVVRALACGGDLWFDEIWTLAGVQHLKSPTEIVTGFRSSNNHHLYSLYVYVVGDVDSWLFRLPSLLAGALTLGMVWLVSRPAGTLAAGIATILTASSYVMIHFSSEGRAYSLVVLSAVTMLFAAQRFADGFGWGFAVLLWVTVALGFFSHAMFLLAFLALGAWLPLRLWRSTRSPHEALLRTLQALLVPVVFLSWFYFAVIKPMDIGGGPPFTWGAILTKTLSFIGGGPAAGGVGVTVALATLALLIWAVISLFRQGAGDALFFVVGIFLAPAFMLLLQQPDVMFVRYFVISTVFGYVAVGRAAADLWQRHQASRRFVIAGLLLFAVGNAINASNLLANKRGHYRDALRFMVEQTRGDMITFTSDHPERNGLVMSYHRRAIPTDKEFGFTPAYDGRGSPPTWMILHRFENPPRMPAGLHDRFGNRYALARHFPYSDMSGWHWFLFRLAGR